jgi:antitoxin CcdA
MGKAELKVEIDADLLEQAKATGVDLDAVTEAAVRQAVKGDNPEARAKRWAEDNAEAIADYNRRIAERGLFGDDLRTW